MVGLLPKPISVAEYLEPKLPCLEGSIGLEEIYRGVLD